MVPEFRTFAQIFSERLLNTAGEGVVIAGLVWVLLRLTGRQNSGTRFAIWFSALLAVAALPFVSGSSFVASQFPSLHPASPMGQIVFPASLAICLFGAWAVGAGLLLVRLSVGLWRIHQFRRKCGDFDLASVDPSVAVVLRDFASHRRVKLCVCTEAAVPAAVGFFRPAIVFPAWLLPQLSADEFKTILLHELAHLRRWDDWTNLAQKIVKALFFFHPAVWWIENHLTLEREMACDDIVLAQVKSPRTYASSLISFAERLQGARGLALAQALVSRMHQMSLRVAQILDAKRARGTRLWTPVLGLSCVVLALILGAAPYVPRVVAFRDQPVQSPTQYAQAVESPSVAAERPAAARATRREAKPVAPGREAGARARAIPATFRPREAKIPLRLKATPPSPAVVRTRALQDEPKIQETIFILRTTQYDASGSGIWTLCVWRMGGTDPAARQLESALFVGVI